MSEKIRRRFICIALLCVFVVLGLFLLFINGWSYLNITETADHTLQLILDNDGTFPGDFSDENKERPTERKDRNISASPFSSPEAPFFTRYFSVTIDENGSVLDSNISNIAAVSVYEAEDMAINAAEGSADKGYNGIYRYHVTQNEDKSVTVTFLDCAKEFYSFHSFMLNSIYVGGTGFLAVAVLIFIFSRAAVRPVAESYEKQKTFITNAGHELKTPISIIDANLEVLEMENGESQWSKSVHNQVERLTRLTNQLTTLAKMEEGGNDINMTEVLFSDGVREVCDEMEAYAQSNGKTIALEAARVRVMGNNDELRQLLYILLDNAVKHSESGSVINVTLLQNGRLTVKNKAQLDQSGNMDILLERFYRTDGSRSRNTGGYGLGLSIAKSIVERHRGKITVNAPDNETLEVIVSLKAV